MFLRIFSLIFFSSLICACSSGSRSWQDIASAIIQSELNTPPQQSSNTLISNSFKSSAYGPGIHQNQYGQPITFFPAGGGLPAEQLQIKPNAYGPGIHMDQYGRPIREKAWP